MNYYVRNRHLNSLPPEFAFPMQTPLVHAATNKTQSCLKPFTTSHFIFSALNEISLCMFLQLWVSMCLFAGVMYRLQQGSKMNQME